MAVSTALPLMYCMMEKPALQDLSEALPGVTTGTGAPGSIVIHVEVCQNPCSTLRAVVLTEHVKALLRKQGTVFGDFIVTEFEDPILKEHAVSVSVSDIPKNLQLVDFSSMRVQVHVFQLHDDGPAAEELDEDCDVSSANHWMLPSAEFHGMWENLVYDIEIKQRLLAAQYTDEGQLTKHLSAAAVTINVVCDVSLYCYSLVQLLDYAQTTLLFSDRGVDANVISWNRVILLHGPPGTGKTSLCKALAQKLCIRLSQRYPYGQLVEINSHSLFSKWFSESGKLVQKMFHKIQELIDDPDALVCVLIDEVESLTAARKSVMMGSEPSDAIRVVNALLTQIDQIKRFPNVIILTTSNITGAIDLAFVDRADIKQYIGLPSAPAIFKIYHSCIRELTRVGIITPAQQILDFRALEVMRFMENDATSLSLKLREIARRSEGLSGRTLRKIPFLAHALFAQTPTVTLEMFLVMLEKAVVEQFAERKDLS